MLNVLLIGPMAAGKSAVATQLEPYGYHRYAMAAPIREIVRTAFPWITGKAQERPYLQKVGAFLREFQPNPILYHAEMALKGTPVVIEDGRTADEAVWAREKGMLVVVLDAPLEVRIKRLQERDGSLPDLRTLTDETERDFTRVQGLRFDTSRALPEAIAQEILRRVGR